MSNHDETQKDFAIPSLPLKQQDPPPPPLSYEQPSWGSIATFNYRVEILKNGASLESIEGPKKDFLTLGRLPLCDITMVHPSISRYHAIIQFDQDGDAYLYDLDSAHGTKLNKTSIPAREYTLLKPGDQMRFGESKRIFIFDSEKPYDPEAENEEKRQIALRQRIAKERGEVADSDASDQGISWGFADDAEEEEAEEGEDENTVEDIAASLNKSGDASLLNVEAEKMAFEDAKRRRQDMEIMYGDDSDEELYDKTKKKNKKVEKATTHDELVIKQKEIEEKIQELEKDIQEKKQTQDSTQQTDEDLDALLEKYSKKQQVKSEKTLFGLVKELNQLKKDNNRLIKLVKLTKPSHVL